MNRQQAALKLVLDALELPTDVSESFNQRLILQKSVYLLQQKGVNLGYHYSWYLRGPYCRALSDDAYAVNGEIVDHYRLDDNTLRTIKSFRESCSEFLGNINKLASWLELAASVLFAVKTQQAKSDDAESIHNALVQGGKNFTLEEVQSVIPYLKSFYA